MTISDNKKYFPSSLGFKKENIRFLPVTTVFGGSLTIASADKNDTCFEPNRKNYFFKRINRANC